MDTDSQWIPDEEWSLIAEGDQYDLVCDPDLGTLVQLTCPDGRTFYGCDPWIRLEIG